MKAYELLADPKSWCQEAFCLDAEGQAVTIGHKAACRWCLMGALQHAYRRDDAETHFKRHEAVRREIRRQFGWRGGPLSWNDTPDRTHAEVLALLRSLNL